jgi:hypothetical protein
MTGGADGQLPSRSAVGTSRCAPERARLTATSGHTMTESTPRQRARRRSRAASFPTPDRILGERDEQRQNTRGVGPHEDLCPATAGVRAALATALAADRRARSI